VSLLGKLLRDVEFLRHVLALLRHWHWRVRARTVHFINDQGEETTMETIKAGESIHFDIVYKDAFGNPTNASDPVTSVSNGLCTFDLDPDGNGVTLTSLGTAGTGQARLDADGDTDPGEEAPIFGLLDFEVIPGNAATAEFTRTPTP
jgi:hypothetical protein